MATSVLWRETTTGYVRYAVLQGVLRVTGYGEPEPPLAGYFVSANDGDDANDGSLEAPFRTITRGIAAASPGDTVYVREGRYVERVVINRSGVPGRPITIKVYPGENSAVDGENMLPTGPAANTVPETGLDFVYTGLVQITGNHIVWDGINVTRSRGRGIRVEANHVTIKNCDVSHHRSACIMYTYGQVYVQHTNPTVENVVALNANTYLTGVQVWNNYSWTACIHIANYDNVVVRESITGSGRGEGFILAACRGGLVSGNICYDSYNTGIWAYFSSDVVIERNLVYTSANYTPSNGIGVGLDYGGAYLAGFSSERNIVINNIVIGRRNGFIYSAYVLETYPPEAGGLKDCVIANNTFLYANMNGKLTSDTRNLGLVVLNDRAVISGTVFYNNICLQDTAKAPMTFGSGHGKCTWDYNCWSPSAPSFAGAHNVAGNPLLNNALAVLTPGGANANNYRLTSASPCRDTGRTVVAVTNDYWETARPVGAAYDIGAHEYEQPQVG